MRHLRALLVLAYLLLITVMAIPAPVGGMQKKMWESEQGRAEVANWAGAVRSIGIDISDRQFAELVWSVGWTWLQSRNAVVEPLRPAFRYTGTRQSWRMFSVVRHHGARVAILLDRGDGFEPLFVAGEHEAWRAHQLNQERTRAFLSSYSGLDGRGSWDGFVDWVAARAAEDFPEGGTVRVELRRSRTLSPEKLHAGKEPKVKLRWVEERTIP